MLSADLNGKEIQKRGDVCIHIADSLCCTAETNSFKAIKKMVIGTNISIITLNVNGLNAPTKRHRLAEWIQK